jgi:hypothetical protein
MKAKEPKGKYAATLAELEASAHVALGDQVAEQPEPPAAAPVSEEEVDRLSFLRVAGAP